MSSRPPPRPGSPGTPSGPDGAKRRRGRRRGPPRGERADVAKPERHAPSASARGLEASHIDAPRPAGAPLTPDVAAEMRGRLRCLCKSREVLRLKVNAAEDLLLNG